MSGCPGPGTERSDGGYKNLSQGAEEGREGGGGKQAGQEWCLTQKLTLGS